MAAITSDSGTSGGRIPAGIYIWQLPISLPVTFGHGSGARTVPAPDPSPKRAVTADILLVSGPDPGHLLPVVGLGAALADRGHRVTVATGADRREAVEEHGLEFRRLPLLAPTGGDDDLGYRLWGRAAEMAVPLAREVERDGAPELVITDTLTRAGGFAAELLGLPWIELSPHHLMEPSDHLPPVGLGRSPDAPWWRRRDDARIRAQQRESIAAGLAYAAEVRGGIGLPAEIRPPIRRLLATIPALEHDRPDWPEDAHVVGPLAADPPWPELVPPPGDRPLVVVTDSTASGLEVSLADVAIDALRELPVRLVVTTARTLRSLPGAVVAGRGPHGPLLDQAALAVGPGGHGFVTKSLSRGVPLVLIPLAGDQRETAARVRHAGLGRDMGPGWLRIPWLAARRLRWEVVQVLGDPHYRQAAEAAAAEAQDLGPEHAAALVEEVLGGAAQANGNGRSTATS